MTHDKIILRTAKYKQRYDACIQTCTYDLAGITKLLQQLKVRNFPKCPINGHFTLACRQFSKPYKIRVWKPNLI